MSPFPTIGVHCSVGQAPWSTSRSGLRRRPQHPAAPATNRATKCDATDETPGCAIIFAALLVKPIKPLEVESASEGEGEMRARGFMTGIHEVPGGEDP